MLCAGDAYMVAAGHDEDEVKVGLSRPSQVLKMIFPPGSLSKWPRWFCFVGSQSLITSFLPGAFSKWPRWVCPLYSQNQVCRFCQVLPGSVAEEAVAVRPCLFPLLRPLPASKSLCMRFHLRVHVPGVWITLPHVCIMPSTHKGLCWAAHSCDAQKGARASSWLQPPLRCSAQGCVRTWRSSMHVHASEVSRVRPLDSIVSLIL